MVLERGRVRERQLKLERWRVRERESGDRVNEGE